MAYSDTPKSAFTSQFNRLLRSALQNVSQGIRSLDVDIPRDNISSCLKRLSLPHLHTLNIGTSFNADLAHFLLAHPKLETLRIVGEMALPANPRGTKGVYKGMSIPMPSLTTFAGPPGSCRIIIPGSQVQDVLLNTSGVQRDPRWEEDALKAVFSSEQPIKTLGFTHFTYRRALFDVMGQWCGGITRLALGLTEPEQVDVRL